ncbi:MAG: hypothetical protein EOP22_12800 [Hyphomicrobiales bacterium]|nr:MAG: hypothetical protein EOP22_12800 [Hyphomicrobiales bacterium]
MTSPVTSTETATVEQRPRRRWEAADTVIAAVGALVFIILAFFVFLCIQGYASSQAQAHTRAQAAADIVANEIKWVAGSSLTALQLVAEKLAMMPTALEPVDKADFDAALSILPAGTQLAIYDVDGLIVPNGGTPGLPANIAGTDYFAAMRQDSAERVILPVTKDAASGEGLMVFAQSLGSDVFAGVALLAVNTSILNEFLEPQNLGDGATVNIVRADGWLVGRSPNVTEPTNFAETSPYWPMVSSQENGTYTAVSTIDGQTRVAGFRHLPNYGLVAFATISQDSIMAGLWAAIISVLWLIIPLSLALIGGSLLTARLLRRSAHNERTLASALAHNEVLFREIHHRVKNNLQSVASLLQMQPIPREIKANMGQRIAAMSAVHEHIYRSNNFSTVDVKGYLQTLIENIRAGQDPKVQVVTELEELSVDKDHGTPLGLILNEVVSNAFKHAFPDDREGAVAVHLIRLDETTGQLTIADNGVGFDPEQPAKGIGRRLITALTQQLGGTSHFESTAEGSQFTLNFPIVSQGTGR